MKKNLIQNRKKQTAMTPAMLRTLDESRPPVVDQDAAQDDGGGQGTDGGVKKMGERMEALVDSVAADIDVVLRPRGELVAAHRDQQQNTNANCDQTEQRCHLSLHRPAVAGRKAALDQMP
jgi:hypothetical protein